jgi:hypothetical protein
MDAGGINRRMMWTADGEVVWSWRPDAGVKSVMMLRITLVVMMPRITPAMVTTKPGHQGEREGNR